MPTINKISFDNLKKELEIINTKFRHMFLIGFMDCYIRFIDKRICKYNLCFWSNRDQISSIDIELKDGTKNN